MGQLSLQKESMIFYSCLLSFIGGRKLASLNILCWKAVDYTVGTVCGCILYYTFLANRLFFFSNWIGEYIQSYILFDSCFLVGASFAPLISLSIFFFSFSSSTLEAVNWQLHWTCPNIIYFVVHCPDRDTENVFHIVSYTLSHFFFRLRHQQKTIVIDWRLKSPWVLLSQN